MGIENIKKCRICNHFFQYPGFGPLMCPQCKAEDEEQFKKVKTYLRDYPGTSLVTVSEACSVPVERIRMWLKDERLEYTDAKDTGLVCEECGRPIASGTLCDECRQALTRTAGEIQRSLDRPKPVEAVIKKADNRDKMRFLNRR